MQLDLQVLVVLQARGVQAQLDLVGLQAQQVLERQVQLAQVGPVGQLVVLEVQEAQE